MVKLSRRDLMTGTMATLMSAGGFSVHGHALDVRASRPIVGAIRWDAWYDPSSVPGQAVERSLGPNKYHFRLPFFGRVIAPNRVTIDGGLREIMDEEIHLAAHAGIDYWAFVGYEQGSSMDKALSLYLSSSQNDRLMFCLISELSRWGSAQHVSPVIERHRKLMLSPKYQHVLNGRPLYFIMAIDESRLQQDWGGPEGPKCELDSLRTWLRALGSGDPYIVIMDEVENNAASLARKLGADAISTYTYAPRKVKGTFAELSAAVTAFWRREAGTGVPVVPTVVTGWDRRPRIDHPVPWERYQRPGDGSKIYYQTAGAGQIAAALRDCLRWVKQHPIEAPAQAIIVYAWNENDEGGWLIPTFPHNVGRLKAVRRVLFSNHDKN